MTTTVKICGIIVLFSSIIILGFIVTSKSQDLKNNASVTEIAKLESQLHKFQRVR